MRALPLIRAALVGVVLVGAAGSAEARGGRNAALLGGAALGVLGGVALGSALANPGPGPLPEPAPAYRPRPVYVEEEPVYVAPRRRGPVCHFERRKEWINDVEFTYRRVEVCE